MNSQTTQHSISGLEEGEGGRELAYTKSQVDVRKTHTHTAVKVWSRRVSSCRRKCQKHLSQNQTAASGALLCRRHPLSYQRWTRGTLGNCGAEFSLASRRPVLRGTGGESIREILYLGEQEGRALSRNPPLGRAASPAPDAHRAAALSAEREREGGGGGEEAGCEVDTRYYCTASGLNMAHPGCLEEKRSCRRRSQVQAIVAASKDRLSRGQEAADPIALPRLTCRRPPDHIPAALHRHTPNTPHGTTHETLTYSIRIPSAFHPRPP
jgi:hypothetical protein